MDYHDRLGETARAAWETFGFGPGDFDMVELHDATSAEEIYALESLGLFGHGEAGPATLAGDTAIGGRGLTVNPSGGLVGRGHPLGATGIAQVVELATHLRGRGGTDRWKAPGSDWPSTPAGSSRATRPMSASTPSPPGGEPGARAHRTELRHRRPRQDPDQRRPLRPPRHQRRVDRRADRHPGTAGRRDDLRAGHRGRPPGARAGRPRTGRHRHRRAGHHHARRHGAGDLGDRAGRARHPRRRLRRQRRLLRASSTAWSPRPA